MYKFEYIPKEFRKDLKSVVFYLENQFRFLSSYKKLKNLHKHQGIVHRIAVDYEESQLFVSGLNSKVFKYDLYDNSQIGFTDKGKFFIKNKSIHAMECV